MQHVEIGNAGAPRSDPNWGGNTGYTRNMAKVMISLPDELLHALDLEAARRSTTRSGLLRSLAESELKKRSSQRAVRMDEIDELYGGTTGHGGNSAELVKANRPN